MTSGFYFVGMTMESLDGLVDAGNDGTGSGSEVKNTLGWADTVVIAGGAGCGVGEGDLLVIMRGFGARGVVVVMTLT